jgi:carboxymethylenebutenolidase
MGRPTGYEAATPDAPKGAVLVLHAWWGLNKDIHQYCERLSESEYTVFAPDLFEGQVANTIEEAQKLTENQQSREQLIRQLIEDSISYLVDSTEFQEITIIGFSYGAYFALEISNLNPHHIRSVVVYYGTGPDEFSASKASYLGHFASDDPYEPIEFVEALEKNIRADERPVEFHIYEGTGHWFAEPSRIDAFDHTAAELAWRRTLDFLERREK